MAITRISYHSLEKQLSFALMNSIFFTGHLYFDEILFLFFQIYTLYWLSDWFINANHTIHVTSAKKQRLFYFNSVFCTRSGPEGWQDSDKR